MVRAETGAASGSRVTAVEAPEGASGPDTEEIPDTLSPQVPVIEAVLDAIGIARVGVPGYEADDIIGTLAGQALWATDIVTGDRDLFQLVDDEAGVRVLYTARGVGRHERVTNDVLRYCHTHGLVLLKAGLYDNVIRLLFPLTISEQELDRGLDILEEALSAAPA